MKTIHVLIAATALAIAPLAVRAQSAHTTTDATGATDATSTADPAEPAIVEGVDPAGPDVGSTGTGTGTIGSTGTGTGTDVGSTGTGTGTVGSTGTGTGTNQVGSTGTGTGTATQSAEPPYVPTVELSSKATSLRTPGVIPLTVTLAAEPGLDPPQGRDVSVPLASSSASCSVPAAVTVAWTSAGGGNASVDVTCRKAGAQTVTISSGDASTAFTTR